MADEPRYRWVAKLRGHTNGVRRRRPVKQSVRAIRGAGHVRRRPPERPRCVRVVGPHAQGLGRRDRHLPDAARTRGRRAAPASSRTARRLLVDAARGAGRVRRRAVARRRRFRVGRPHAQGLGRVERLAVLAAERAHELSAAPASSRTARRSLVDAARRAGRVRRRPVERPRRVRVARLHAQGVGRCRGEDGTSGCPPPDSEEFRRASHRRVPLGPLVCFVSASRWHGI